MIINIKNIKDDIVSDLRYLNGLPYPNSKIKKQIKAESDVLERVKAVLDKYLREERYEK